MEPNLAPSKAHLNLESMTINNVDLFVLGCQGLWRLGRFLLRGLLGVRVNIWRNGTSETDRDRLPLEVAGVGDDHVRDSWSWHLEVLFDSGRSRLPHDSQDSPLELEFQATQTWQPGESYVRGHRLRLPFGKEDRFLRLDLLHGRDLVRRKWIDVVRHGEMLVCG